MRSYKDAVMMNERRHHDNYLTERVQGMFNIDQAASNFQRISKRLLKAIESKRQPSDHAATLPKAIETFQQFLAITKRVQSERNALSSNDITQLGDYGLNILLDLETKVKVLDLQGLQPSLEELCLAVAEWVVRCNGRIQTLEPIVDVLARRANQTKQHSELEKLTAFMSQIINACGDIIKSDFESSNPGRPWCILHLNRGITATRSHNPALMEMAFDAIVTVLPEDAAQFFSEGMREMDRLSYPLEIRMVMQRYFDRFARPTMH